MNSGKRKLTITKKHSLGSIVVFFVCLLLASMFVISFFVTPWLSFNLGGAYEGKLMGMDFINRIIAKINTKPINGDDYLIFNEYFQYLLQHGTSNSIFLKIYKISLILIPGFYALGLITSLFMLINAFTFLFKGRNNAGGTPIGLTIFYFIIAIFAIGSAIVLGVVANVLESRLIGGPSGITTKSSFNLMWPIIYLSICVAAIVIFIFVKVTTYGANRIWCEDAEFEDYIADRVKQKVAPNGVLASANQSGVNFPNNININVNKGQNANLERNVTKITYKNATGLPATVSNIGGHAYSNNQNLVTAVIPQGVTSIGQGAFANCGSLRIVSLPRSLRSIGKNCFFNCANVQRINFAGTKEEWRHIRRGSNWLLKGGTNVVICVDGSILVDPVR